MGNAQLGQWPDSFCWPTAQCFVHWQSSLGVTGACLCDSCQHPTVPDKAKLWGGCLRMAMKTMTWTGCRGVTFSQDPKWGRCGKAT